MDNDTWGDDPAIEYYGVGHNASASCGMWDGGNWFGGKWCYVANDESCLVKTKEWNRDTYWVECEGSGRLKLLAYLFLTITIFNICS